jgi:4-alpha-glucanotransferase
MTASVQALPRCSGVLLHVTSLPGRGIGDLGDSAYRWIDWLADAGQSIWQILPLVPVTLGGSPYNGLSAMAGNSLLVSPERLVEAGLLDAERVGGERFPDERLDFPAVIRWKESLLRAAFRAFRDGAAPDLRPQLERFRARQRGWIEDYALFRAVRDAHGGRPWVDWERDIRLRLPGAVTRWRDRLRQRVEEHVFRQFLFDRQWQELRRYAGARGVRIMGDIPIFVAHDSADVWADRELFSLDEEGFPLLVSGVPPDYFSATGQRWGNPLYRWDVMAGRGFQWWTGRFQRTMELVDIVRVDHFRGFHAYWEIPAEEETALNGRWVPGPGAALFDRVQQRLGSLPIVAEDLGLITPEVEELRLQLGFPGMRVLQFAFDGDPANPHLPTNHRRDCVAYTGTHDNATIMEWWENADPETRAQVAAMLAGGEAVRDAAGEQLRWSLTTAVWRSPALLAVAPLQDVIGLGAEARMNTPGTGPGNWAWRLAPHLLSADAARRLREITLETDRLAAGASRSSNPSSSR